MRPSKGPNSGCAGDIRTKLRIFEKKTEVVVSFMPPGVSVFYFIVSIVKQGIVCSQS